MAEQEKLSLYARIRQMIQPYYRPKPKGQKRKSKKEQKVEIAAAAEMSKSVNGDKDVLISLRNTKTPLTSAAAIKPKPRPDQAWFYGDANMLQIFACFDAKAGYRYPDRSDTERKKLKPLLFPDEGKPFDRTHLIPIGYHGSEKDNRLLVGWNSEQNRNILNEFEKRAKEIPHPIYWLTSINRVPGGMDWHYRIFDARDPEKVPSPLLMKLDVEYRGKYVWRIGA